MNQDGNIFINDKNIDGDPLKIWQTCIDKWKKNKGDNEISALGFFSYDFKNILYPNYQFKNHRNSKTLIFGLVSHLVLLVLMIINIIMRRKISS